MDKNIRYQWIWPYCIYCIFLYIFKFIYDFRIFKVDDPGTDPDPNALCDRL